MLNDKNRNIKPKIYILIFFAIFWFAVFIITLFRLQIINNKQYSEKVNLMSIREITIFALRGEILDRNNQILATNKDSFQISIIPAEISSTDIIKTVEKLSYSLDIDKNEILKKIPKKLYKSYEPIDIVTGLDLKDINPIIENYDTFKGIYWSNNSIRKYNDIGSLFHVIGYVNEISLDELQVLYNKGYTARTYIGKSGIEKQYDEFLKGKNGKKLKAVDVKGREIKSTHLNDLPPTKGNNIVLTIDKDIQKLAELALGDRVGEIIVMKPSTGEILAMVSYPWIDGNIFYQLNNSKKLSEHYNDKNKPFLNRAISGTYPPASTFKSVMATIILDRNLFPTDQYINCTGKLYFGDRYFKCNKETGHGKMNLPNAIANSCNVYFYTIASKYIDIEYIVEYCKMFGLGESTGIDLLEERIGILPSPEWKKSVYNRGWVGGDTVNLSIGQGFITVNPLQLCNIYSMIINEGKIYKPHFLKEVRDDITGKIIKKNNPEILIDSKIDPAVFKELKKYLRLVTTDGSTKNVLNNKKLQIAGKTGTSQIAGYEDRYHSWYVGYAPYDKPVEEQVLVCVGVEPQEKKEWWTPFAAHIILNGVINNLDFYNSVKSLNWQWLFKNFEEVYGRKE